MDDEKGHPSGSAAQRHRTYQILHRAGYLAD